MRLIKIIEDNNTDFSLVVLKDNLPHCKLHGAMLKVSEAGYWRCIRAKGQIDCRAGCEEFAGYCPHCGGICKKEIKTGNFKTFSVCICKDCNDQIAETASRLNI